MITKKRNPKHNIPKEIKKESIPRIYFDLIIFLLILLILVIRFHEQEVKVNLSYNVEILDRLKCSYNETIGNSTETYYVTFVDYSDLESFQRLSGMEYLHCEEVKEYPILI